MALQVRVSGQAEFGQIKREVRDLDRNMNTLQRTVDKGMGRGFFSREQARSAEHMMTQLKDGQRNLNGLLDEQRTKLADIRQQYDGASGERRKQLHSELEQRKEIVRTYEDELSYMRRRATQLQQQMGGMQTSGSEGAGGLDAGSVSALKMVAGTASKVLGFLGIAGAGALLQQGVATARAQHTQISALGMRVGGARPDFERLRLGMRDAGMGLGYSAMESMAVQEAFSSRAGGMTLGDQTAIQGFSRAFGLDATQTGGVFGEMAKMGGSAVGGQREFAGMIANALESGRMQARAVEAMEATAGLMGDMLQRLPEASGLGLLSLQTLLNQTGVAGFMGEYGAQRIGELNQMFQGGSRGTDFFVSRALGWGQGSDWYDVQLRKDQGVSNPANLRAVMSSLQQIGDPRMQDFALSNMTGMSLTMAKTLREETGGYTDLTSGRIEQLMGELTGEDSLETRIGSFSDSMGGWIQIVDTRFDELTTEIGNELIPAMQGLKESFSSGMENFISVFGSDVISKDSPALNPISGITGAGLIGGGVLGTSLIAQLFGGKGAAGAGAGAGAGSAAGGGLLSSLLGIGTIGSVGIGAYSLIEEGIRAVGGDKAAQESIKAWTTLNRQIERDPLGYMERDIYEFKEGSLGIFERAFGRLGTFFNTVGPGANPFNGLRVTSPFGPRTPPTPGASSFHSGVDFAMPQGTPLTAVGSGEVTFSGLSNGAGGHIKIQLDTGEMVEYMHLSQRNVQTGDTVVGGQFIGLSGGAVGTPGAGTSTGPHLHFGVAQNGQYIDPQKWLRERFGGGGTHGVVDVNLHVDGNTSGFEVDRLKEIFQQVVQEQSFNNVIVNASLQQ